VNGWGQSEDPFASAGVPPSKYDIFGGSIGGPTVRNKLFIFGDYQGTRSSQGANVLLNVPTQTVRNTCLGMIGGSSKMALRFKFIAAEYAESANVLVFCA
jgi:hypothetical protein